MPEIKVQPMCVRCEKKTNRTIKFAKPLASKFQQFFDELFSPQILMESFGSTRTSKPQRCIPPRLLMLATLTITLQHLAAASDATTTTTTTDSDSDCPPATCGDLTITYPFTLGGGRSNSSCGPPAFRLACDSSGSAAFLGNSNSYIHVLSIDYGNRSLVAAHVLLVTDAGCTDIFNVSSALAIVDSFTISASNRELYVMSKCGGTLPPPGAVPITNCSGNSTGNFAYLGGGYGTGSPPANDGHCELGVAPVLGSAAEGGATSASYRQLFKDGFLLDWEPAGDCDACTASGGRCRYDASSSAFACLCSDRSMRSSTCEGKRTRKLTLIVSMSIVATALVLICLAWLIYRQKQKFRSGVWKAHSTDRSNEEEVLRRWGSLAPQRYKYSELRTITKSFKEKLGEGGYGVVFKGSLRDGRMVAVKLLKGSKGNGDDFLNEVMSISQTSHINIVNLLGFCLEGSNRALVYEYMPNGSLEKYIYSELVIGWEMMLKIAIGIARGLEYLHQGCNTRIIHFDIKPHNILLDNEFCPKISDFGLAKLCHLNGSILSTAEARGTIGFIAPEVFSRAFGAVSTKSDVYSYGMMLLEMVRGKSNMKGPTNDSSEAFFPYLLYDHLARDMQGCQITHGTEEIARKLTSVGLYCIQMAPDDRPSMGKVIEMLEKSANEFEMPLPPKPFLYSPLQSANASSITTVTISMSS